MKAFLFLFFAFLCITALAQVPSIQQSLSMKSVGSPQLSPDGQWVAYVVAETNWEENAYETEIWLARTTTGEKFQLTNSKKSNSSPTWSPDGKMLAFLSTRDDKSQIYLINPHGGEAKALTKFETGVNTFKFTPDGQSVVFSATVPDTKADKSRKEKYGDYEVVHEDYKMTHLYVVPIAGLDNKSSEPKSLTKGTDFSVNNFSLSPDGKKIAFDATKNPDLINGHTADIYVLSLSDTTVKKIVSLKGPDNNPVWSPDGKQIAFVTTNENEFYFYANRMIATVAAEGGVATLLTQKFDENAGLLEWSKEGIWFSGLQKTTSHLFLLNPDSQQITKISQPNTLIGSQFSFSKDFKQTAFVKAEPNQMAEIAVGNIGATPQILTQMGEQLKVFKTSTGKLSVGNRKMALPLKGF
ncbi:MAG: DPP IV N-terminal domain-containing protein [Spirosomataceae bacterium]